MKKKSIIKRVLSLVIVIVMLALCGTAFVGCDRDYDEQEVLFAASDLLSKAETLNQIYYGNGISYTTTGSSDGYYYQADNMHLSSLGFDTVDGLKRITEQTFTQDYSSEIYSIFLSPITDGEYILGMARYYQLYEDQINKRDPICIMVYSKYSPILKDRISYDYSSLRVSGVEKETVFITVTATVTNSEGKSQTRDIEFGLIEEAGGWRINSPTFANYSEAY